MNGWGVFFIILLLLLVFSYAGWYFYARWNASRNGLPPPSMNPIAAFRSNAPSAEASNYPGPAPTGVKGWFGAQIHKFKNRNNRYTTGSGYEDSGYNGQRGVGGGRGAGSRLDPDEAWSSRVGDEAYYEEQELGLHEPPASHQQTANPFATAATEPARGRSRTRDEYDERLDVRNPFGDDNAASLRGVSPRPVMNADTSYHGGATATMPSVSQHQHRASRGSRENSPTESRRSIFKEGL